MDVCLNQPLRIKESTSARDKSQSKSSLPHTRSDSKPCIDSKTLYDTLYKSFPNAALFSVVPGYNVTSSIPTHEQEPDLAFRI